MQPGAISSGKIKYKVLLLGKRTCSLFFVSFGFCVYRSSYITSMYNTVSSYIKFDLA